MNWNHFLQALGAAYLFYYVVLIAFDLEGRRRLSKEKPGLQELTFHQEELPRQITLDDPLTKDYSQVQSELAVKASSGSTPAAGGVSMTNLVDLAKAEVGAYTRQIPY